MQCTVQSVTTLKRAGCGGKSNHSWNVLSRRPIESPPVAFSVENSLGLRRFHLLHLTDSEHYGKQRHEV
jgi:hypothetical protein